MGQLVFQATAGGQVALVGPNPSSNFSLNVPAVNGNLVTTGDTGTVTNTMISGPINATNGGTGVAGTLTGILYGNGTSVHTVATTAQALSLIGTVPVANGGTGLTSLTAGYIPYGNGTSAFSSSSSLYFDGTNLGIGTTSPGAKLDISGSIGALNRSVKITPTTEASTIDALRTLAIQRVSNDTTLALGYATTPDAWVISSSYGSTGAYKPLVFATSDAERMRIDTSGNVGIGLSTMTAKFVVAGTSPYGSGSQATYPGTIQINESGSFTLQTTGGLEFKGSVFGAGYGAKIFGADNGILIFGNRSNSATWTEAMRIDQGSNLLVGTTTSPGNGTVGFYVGSGGQGVLQSAPSANANYVMYKPASASQAAYVLFQTGASNVGSITQNGTTGVLYNLTSDYRLKNNLQPLTGASEFIMSLQPKTWDWWDGSGKGVGFIAHEFMEVAKYSGNGKKDEVDADGKPIYQSIQPSSSEVMANLVGLVQELNAKVIALEAKLGA